MAALSARTRIWLRRKLGSRDAAEAINTIIAADSGSLDDRSRRRLEKALGSKQHANSFITQMTTGALNGGEYKRMFLGTRREAVDDINTQTTGNA